MKAFISQVSSGQLVLYPLDSRFIASKQNPVPAPLQRCKPLKEPRCPAQKEYPEERVSLMTQQYINCPIGPSLCFLLEDLLVAAHRLCMQYIPSGFQNH